MIFKRHGWLGEFRADAENMRTGHDDMEGPQNTLLPGSKHLLTSELTYKLNSTTEALWSFRIRYGVQSPRFTS